MATGRIPSTGQIVSTPGPLGRTPMRGKVLWVNKVANDGWMQARPMDRPGPLVPLPKYTMVELIELRAGRVYFRVLDGPHQRRVMSVSEPNSFEYLGSRFPIHKPAEIVVTYGKYVEGWMSEAQKRNYRQQLATLEVAGISVRVTMNSIWTERFTPLPAGHYKVLLPGYPHDKSMTRFYREIEPGLRFDQVWFPIQHGDNSRFVHVGNVSEGCVTVLDLARWSEIHEALISHRDPDGKSVANLVVKGTPERAK